MRCRFPLALLLLAVAVACAPSEDSNSVMVRMVFPKGDAAAGRQAFIDLKCTVCHPVRGSQGLPAVENKEPGPDLGVTLQGQPRSRHRQLHRGSGPRQCRRCRAVDGPHRRGASLAGSWPRAGEAGGRENPFEDGELPAGHDGSSIDRSGGLLEVDCRSRLTGSNARVEGAVTPGLFA